MTLYMVFVSKEEFYVVDTLNGAHKLIEETGGDIYLCTPVDTEDIDTDLMLDKSIENMYK